MAHRPGRRCIGDPNRQRHRHADRELAAVRGDRHHCRHRHRGRGQPLLHPGGDGRDQRLLRDHRGSQLEQGTVAAELRVDPAQHRARQGAALLLAVGRRPCLSTADSPFMCAAQSATVAVCKAPMHVGVPCSADHRVHVRHAEAAGGRHRYRAHCLRRRSHYERHLGGRQRVDHRNRGVGRHRRACGHPDGQATPPVAGCITATADF